MVAPTDLVEILRRFAEVGVCPQCRSELELASAEAARLKCTHCGAGIGAEEGFLSALPLNHPVRCVAVPAPVGQRGWAAGIAADMNRKSAAYLCKYERCTLASRGYILRRTLALEMAGTQPGRVLEAGCGPGIVAPLLAASGGDVHGVDLSAEQLRLAATGDTKSVYVHSDLQKLPYRDDVFDTVLMLGVFEYLERPREVLREIARVTRPGGALVLSLPNAQGIGRAWTQHVYIPLTQACKRALRKPVPDYSRTLYTLRRFAHLAEDAGLLVDTSHYFDIVLTPPPFLRVAPKSIIRLLDIFEARLKGSLRRAFADQFMVSAKLVAR